MRRMNYNPFEKPFASGEYDGEGGYFLLDKRLEPNHLYYVVIHSSDGYALGPSFIDLRTRENSSVLVPMWDEADEMNVFTMSGRQLDNLISISYVTKPLSTAYQYTIFVYQII